MSNAQLAVERRTYLADAKARAQALRERAARNAPTWNPGTGLPEVDALAWFDYVHADAPWAGVPAHGPERALPARCSFFSELPA
jgi:hypothetical protein